MTKQSTKMNESSSSLPEAFILAVQAELEHQAYAINEYDLIQSLKLQGYFDFLSNPALPHELFHAHFILFHALYTLRNKYLKNKTYILNIHTLNIQLLPYNKGENELQEEQKLMAYYLDFSNLEKTSEDDVYDMLASFWKKYHHYDNRDEALSELNLKDPVSDTEIKQAYRRLIMQHHPDRGGETEKLQKLNDAIKSLLG